MSGYKKMFDISASVPPSAADLDQLAQYMTRTQGFYEVPSPFKELPEVLGEAIGVNLSKSMLKIFESLNKPLLDFDTLELLDKDLLNSEIPAGYSYLGQFLLHDISFDEKSDRFDAAHYPWNNPSQPIKNLRKPFLDLETIYGNEKVPPSHLLLENSSLLKLGDTLKNSAATSGIHLSERDYPNDLLRKEKSVKADIIDPRNDENLLLAQTQVAFTKFHNAIVHKLGNLNSMAVFEQARKMTIRHYQYIILNDFLPKIVQEDVLKKIISEVQNGTNKFYHPTKNNMFIPLEFVVGAYRTAHSMIRHTYSLNKEVNNREATLTTMLLFTGRGAMNAANEQEAKQRIKLPSRWIINWKWFYDIDNSKSTDKDFFNFARKIDTNLSASLGILFPGGKERKANSLSALDLHRGVFWKLPTGNNLAKEMAKRDSEITVLTSEEIDSKLDKQLTLGQPKFTRLTSTQRKFFTENTPLLFYLLAEAEIQCGGESLGDVGSRIVAETLVKLIYESPHSILQKGQDLESDDDFLLNDSEMFKALGPKDKKTFGMPEMLKFIAVARTKLKDPFDELNPLG